MPVHLVSTSFEYIKHLMGGTGGVHVLKANGKKWVLKAWAHHAHGINETLARYLLDSLTNTNSLHNNFFVNANLPDTIQRCIADKIPGLLDKSTLFSLAPFVEKAKDSNTTRKHEEIRKHFATLCLLSFWDLTDENMILASDGLHFIDTGGSFLYRAMGARKTASDQWSLFYVSELITLPEYYPEYFKNINADELAIQLKPLVDASSLILERANEFCLGLQSTERFDIVSMLSNRLRHFTDLYNYLLGTWASKADAFLQANPQDAAGTLIWFHDPLTNEPMIIIDQKVGHTWWSNLGGKADLGDLLHETAARETKEKSGRLICVTPHDFTNLPSHDLVSFEKLIPHRFRTYLYHADYSDSALLKDDRYTDYKWLPVSAVLMALKNNDGICEEDQETICIADYIINPTFSKSLQQHEIKTWLECLFKGQPIPTVHTQGIEESFGFKPVSYHTLFNPISVQTELTYSFMNNRYGQNQNEDIRTKGETLGSSHHMLSYLAKQQGMAEGLSPFEKMKALNAHRFNLSDEQIQNLEHIIDEEKKYPDHFVAYHGLQSDIWLTYRILSYIYHYFNGTPLQKNIIRSSHSFFKELPTVEAIKQKARQSSDHRPSLLATCLSCNPTLFSNYKIPDEETLSFFLEPCNFHVPNITNIVIAALTELGITDNFLINELKTLIARESEDKEIGALLQFFIPKKFIDSTAYLSEAYGTPIDADTDTVLTQISRGDLNSEVNKMQLRLHCNLNAYSIIVKDYFSDGSSTFLKDELIEKLITSYLFKIAGRLVSNASLYGQPTYFQTGIRLALDIQDWDLQESVSPIIAAYKSKNLITLKTALCVHVDTKNITYQDNGTLKTKIIGSEFLSWVKNTDDYSLNRMQNLLMSETINFECHFKPLLKFNNINSIAFGAAVDIVQSEAFWKAVENEEKEKDSYIQRRKITKFFHYFLEKNIQSHIINQIIQIVLKITHHFISSNLKINDFLLLLELFNNNNYNSKLIKIDRALQAIINTKTKIKKLYSRDFLYFKNANAEEMIKFLEELKS